MGPFCGVELSLRLIRRYVHAEKRAAQLRVHLKDVDAVKDDEINAKAGPHVSLPSVVTKDADVARLRTEQATAQLAECKIVVRTQSPPTTRPFRIDRTHT